MKENKQRKLRVLWSSNAPFAYSGYSVQTKDVVFRLNNAGFPIAINCYWGLEGGTISLNGVRCYPKLVDPWGTDGCYEHGKDFQADVVITMQDIWNLNPNLLKQVKNWIPYVPIDFDPLPSAFINNLKFAYRIITFSRWGQKQLEKYGFASKLILEGVDTSVFKPMDRSEARKKFGLPQDAFIFGMVAANKDNPPRKQFQRVMDAFAQFKKNHDEAHLFLHTIWKQPGGFDIEQYGNYLGLHGSIHSLSPYHTFWKGGPEIISPLMNTFDVLLCPSEREGFGLPIMEAQACGKPVIATDWTAMSELVKVGKTGYLCGLESKRWVPTGAYVANPKTSDIYKYMEELYKSDKEKVAKECRKHALEYDIEKRVHNEWIPYLEDLEQEIYKGGGK